MQKRIEIPSVGTAYPFLKYKLLRLVMDWPDETLTVTNEELKTLCLIATEPHWLISKPTIVLPEHMAGIYAIAPDFALAVLTKARHEWKKLDKSLSGRIKKFLATNSQYKPKGNFAARPWCKIKGHSEAATDGDIAQAFEIAKGETVSVELVTKARKAVAAQVKSGIKLHAKLTSAPLRGGKKSKKPSV